MRPPAWPAETPSLLSGRAVGRGRSQAVKDGEAALRPPSTSRAVLRPAPTHADHVGQTRDGNTAGVRAGILCKPEGWCQLPGGAGGMPVHGKLLAALLLAGSTRTGAQAAAGAHSDGKWSLGQCCTKATTGVLPGGGQGVSRVRLWWHPGWPTQPLLLQTHTHANIGCFPGHGRAQAHGAATASVGPAARQHHHSHRHWRPHACRQLRHRFQLLLEGHSMLPSRGGPVRPPCIVCRPPLASSSRQACRPPGAVFAGLEVVVAARLVAAHLVGAGCKAKPDYAGSAHCHSSTCAYPRPLQVPAGLCPLLQLQECAGFWDSQPP